MKKAWLVEAGPRSPVNMKPCINPFELAGRQAKRAPDTGGLLPPGAQGKQTWLCLRDGLHPKSWLTLHHRMPVVESKCAWCVLV